MNENLPDSSRAIVDYLAHVRGATIAAMLKHPRPGKGKTPEALRKQCDRLVERGWLAKSSLPGGTQLFRLSRRGAQLIGAPVSFAEPPTAAIAYEMEATSHIAWRTDEFFFLTRQELLAVCSRLQPDFQMERFQGRFLLLRTASANGFEHHLNYWLAEFKPADHLARRVEAIVTGLARSSTLFPAMIERGVFGVAIAVPSEGVADTLRQKTLPVATTVVVIPELMPVAGTVHP